jgi:hypothetical protein
MPKPHTATTLNLTWNIRAGEEGPPKESPVASPWWKVNLSEAKENTGWGATNHRTKATDLLRRH